MNLRHVEIFRRVMETGSTKNAAKILLISQPAVSKMLAQFERQLGFTLFQRMGGRLVPTFEAEQLFESSNSIFSSFSQFSSEVDRIRDSKSGALKILASPSFSQSILSDALVNFSNDYPKVKLYFDTPNQETMTQLLLDHQYEIGLTITPIAHPLIISKPLSRAKLVCAFHKDHEFSQLDHISIEQINNEKLISYPRNSPIGQIINDVFLQNQIEQQVDIEVRYCATACNLINAGVGVTIVDVFTLCNRSFNNVRYIPIEGKHSITIFSATPRTKPLSKIAKIFFKDYFKFDQNKELLK
ncbi:LysR family transcriptional regulator [Photobacterium minamisatsumaniensis]|uniref:LysR family transcriptional regulator n=1 Tax=Photobacterium minamisatsumaniensis TaxID=2910233 RepID=UPI003D131A3D